MILQKTAYKCRRRIMVPPLNWLIGKEKAPLEQGLSQGALA
jgi:hypothetical protein